MKKKPVKKIQLLKKPSGNEHKMKKKCSLRKRWASGATSTSTCYNSKIEAPAQSMKYVQIYKYRH